MKSLFVASLFCIFLLQISYSQNTFPSTGNVAIGTSSPQANLEIGNGSYSNGNQLIISGGEPTRYYGQIQTTVTTGYTVFSLGVKSNYTNYFQTLNIINGNVGIGTTNLPAKFNVYQSVGLGSTPQNASLLSTVSGLAGTANNFQNNIWLVRNASGSDWYTTRLHDGIAIDGSFQNPQINTRTWWERDPGQDVQSWGTAATTYLTIASGNVGIGTTNTLGYKLAINGTTIATSMTVKAYANWPDYVFKKNYSLPSLAAIKIYIDQNHHLPEMPSEQEVAKDGLNLGEMNKLLVKKVEELTLYLIEQNKRIEKLESQLKTINNEK